MFAMPTASDGAPPVRANRVASPISAARASICATVTGKPQLEMVDTAAAASWPTTPAGLLMAKNTPGSSTQAAIIAITAVNDSIIMPP